MKPYLYIVGVLLVGGCIGFLLGQRSSQFERALSPPAESKLGDSQLVQKILDRQAEAYRLHDASLLLRDCTNTYVEIDGNTGESMGLVRSIISYQEQFRSGARIDFVLRDVAIDTRQNAAVIRANYSKTSDSYDQQGIKGYVGEGIWLLSRSNSRWQISAFSRVETVKH